MAGPSQRSKRILTLALNKQLSEHIKTIRSNKVKTRKLYNEVDDNYDEDPDFSGTYVFPILPGINANLFQLQNRDSKF